MNFVGIDPGLKGAIAIISHGTGKLRLIPFSSLHEKDQKFFHLPLLTPEVVSLRGHSFIFMENVHAMTGQGVSSSFSFGWNTGMIEGVLQYEGFQVNKVLPLTWQKELGLLNCTDGKEFKSVGSKKAARKKAYVQKAKELFPNDAARINLETADAILIAEYARKVFYGRL